MKSVLLSLAVLVAFVVVSVAVDSPPAQASNMCLSVEADPDPPIGQPDLVIGGHIDLEGPGSLEGAKVTLYRCGGTTAILAASANTDSGGGYEFTDDLVEGKWHYVMVSLTGPLAGKRPAAGTTNPSELIAVGYGDDEVDFSFED